MKLLVLFLISLTPSIIFASPEDDLRAGNQRFTESLYKGILKNRQTKNFVYSPFPVQTLLAMLTSAAPNSNSPSVVEIRNSVGLPRDNTQTEQAFQNIISDHNKANSDDFKIFDASKLYFANGYTVKPWYKNVVQNVYGAEIETVNFYNSQSTTDNINSWVSKKTDNTINDFIDATEITGNTQNVLVNALFLKAKWDKPFDKLKNTRKNFYGTQATREVEMIFNSQTYWYAEDDSAQYLKLGLVTAEGDAYMLFILPNKTTSTLMQLENKVDSLLSRQSYFVANVDVTLPKFRIETSVKLKPILEQLGVRKLFNWGLELEGLRYGGHPYTKISDVFQKSFIELSEWGIVAASAIEGEGIVDDTEEHRVFHADHPFLFQIVVKNVTLYAGRVVSL